ncbi:thymidylate kinase-domain-containing protein [Daldinia vernicosa]|uniref:thymidylate kinase-domain-containing protein n=1 Tax=Daldinia vernicosa TaxID=114800 RepID=UPI002007F849|nr:thymidylate kinase-domain-containing protein [Daldinia vernicosa]KAI0849966.1 thymidylate kinase-domain-containing protein [Daldinia vernicosa]
MASINDLATAATIASSAVALQSSPTREGAQPATPPAEPRSPPSSRPATDGAQSTSPLTEKSKLVNANEDGDSITVATGAPPVLAPPQISPQNPSQAQIPAPAPAAAEVEPAEAVKDVSIEDKDAVDNSAGDDMDGIEKVVAPPSKPVRGAFVVFEGMDRAGKTTQAKLLQQRCIESGREVRFMRFPDRTTPIGKMIDSYLKGETEIEDHVIHLLFSANRWEAVKKIKTELEAGHTIICDRFYHSGIVYSAAKNIKSLSLSWAKAPEVGLPRPDMVLFLDLEEEVARERGGWGGEVYEKGEMQRRVRDLFWGLSMGDLGSAVGNNGSSKVPRRGGEAERLGNGTSRGGDGSNSEEGEFRQEEEDIQIVDADLDVESLSERVWDLVLPRLEAVERGEVGRTVRIVR